VRSGRGETSLALDRADPPGLTVAIGTLPAVSSRRFWRSRADLQAHLSAPSPRRRRCPDSDQAAALVDRLFFAARLRRLEGLHCGQSRPCESRARSSHSSRSSLASSPSGSSCSSRSSRASAIAALTRPSRARRLRMASASVLVATSLPLGGSWQLAKEGGPGSAAGPQLVQAGELVVRETHHHAVCSTRGHDCASRLRWPLEEPGV
jgi:hypothetical protein